MGGSQMGVTPNPSPAQPEAARYVLRNGRRLCTYRGFEPLFEGETPVTNPDLDDDK